MEQPHKNTNELNPIFLRIIPNDIVYLKAILESYDELGVLRTLDKKTGDVVILTLPELAPELNKLLDGLMSEIHFVRVDPPPVGKTGEDWLIGEDYCFSNFSRISLTS